MKIGKIFSGFDISAKGLSIQRKKMNLISENIANADNVRNANGQPYQRRYLQVSEIGGQKFSNIMSGEQNVRLEVTNPDHIKFPNNQMPNNMPNGENVNMNELVDKSQGELVYMPDSPYANEKGYVQMSNVNIVNEMVDMISATRGYEANLTALNSSKQMAKDSLDI